MSANVHTTSTRNLGYYLGHVARLSFISDSDAACDSGDPVAARVATVQSVAARSAAAGATCADAGRMRRWLVGRRRTGGSNQDAEGESGPGAAAAAGGAHAVHLQRRAERREA